MLSFHVSRSANGKEIKESSAVASFPRTSSPRRSLCLRVRNALEINKVTVRARAQPEERATTAEVRSPSECNGAVQWLAKDSRRDLAVQVSMSQQALSDPRVRHCLQANAMVRRARQRHDLVWRFLPVPLDDLRLVMHTDAAFQNAHGGASQAGYIIVVTDDRLAKGGNGAVEPL